MVNSFNKFLNENNEMVVDYNTLELRLNAFLLHIHLDNDIKNYLLHFLLYYKTIFIKYNVNSFPEIFHNILSVNERKSNNINLINFNKLYLFIKKDYGSLIVFYKKFDLLNEFQSFVIVLESILNITKSLKSIFDEKLEIYNLDRNRYDSFNSLLKTAIENDNLYIFCELNFEKLKQNNDYIYYDTIEKIKETYTIIYYYIFNLYGYINKRYFERVLPYLNIKPNDVIFEPRSKSNSTYNSLNDILIEVEEYRLIDELINKLKNKKQVFEINEFINSNISYFNFSMPISLWYYKCYKNNIRKSDLQYLSLVSGNNINKLTL